MTMSRRTFCETAAMAGALAFGAGARAYAGDVEQSPETSAISEAAEKILTLLEEKPEDGPAILNKVLAGLESHIEPGESWIVSFNGALVGGARPTVETASVRTGNPATDEIRSAGDLMALIAGQSAKDLPQISALDGMTLPTAAAGRAIQGAGAADWNIAFATDPSVKEGARVISVAIFKPGEGWRIVKSDAAR